MKHVIKSSIYLLKELADLLLLKIRLEIERKKKENKTELSRRHWVMCGIYAQARKGLFLKFIKQEIN